MRQHTQPELPLSLDAFKHWLNNQRMTSVSEVFHEIVGHYRAALASAQAQPSLTDERAAFEKLIAEAERANKTALREVGIGLIDLNAIEQARAALATQAAQAEHEDTRLLDFLDDMGGNWFAANEPDGFKITQDHGKIGQTVRDALREAAGLSLDETEQPVQARGVPKGIYPPEWVEFAKRLERVQNNAAATSPQQAEPLRDSDKLDAERYRWLRGFGQAASLDIAGNHAWRHRIPGNLRGASFDEAIDAARGIKGAK